MKKYLLLVAWSISVLSAWGQESFPEIDSLIKRALPPGSEVGISVYDLTDGRSLYTFRDEKLSRPASTMKLITGITTLARADADEPFRTEVWHDGVIRNDTLIGNLYVVGGFDPEFDNKAMDALVHKVSKGHFSVVTGQVYGDISMTDSLYWGSGWLWDDNPEDFQPYLSPLMLCKGVVEVNASPGSRREQEAKLTLIPVSSYYTVSNGTKTKTPNAGKFSVSRDWMRDKNEIIVKGNVSGHQRKRVNVYDSSRYFMHTFLERLRDSGLSVPSSYGFAELPAKDVTLLSHWESPMEQVLAQLMKESDNLNAEALLYRLGSRATGRKGVTAKDGVEEITKLVRQLGHDPELYNFADGSGLSNYNYVSPALLVDFLKFAYSEKNVYHKLYKSLPIAGVEGTLKHRMKGTSASGNARAKSGSFTAINALAGYIKSKGGHQIAFAIMNQNTLSASKAMTFQNKVCEILADKW